MRGGGQAEEGEGRPHRTRGWWRRWFITPGELAALGLVGLNGRNGHYLLPHNPRKFYPRVDDKVESKRLARAAGIAVPETYAVLDSPGGIRRALAVIREKGECVVKPARGSGGRGVVVVAGCLGDDFIKPSGAVVNEEEMRWHMTNILGGLHSLGGQRDRALIEYRVRPAPLFERVSVLGVPDIRVVLYHGYPVMAMLRLATRHSDGRANLHQGAVGVGIDLAAGTALHAVCRGRVVDVHPDTRFPISEIAIPDWGNLLELAARSYEVTGFGYLGVDMIVDHSRGPVVIEFNARPGLAIQVANGLGMAPRLRAVEAHRKRLDGGEGPEERVAFSRSELAVAGNARPAGKA